MTQHDYNVANGDGATFRADLNNALASAVSLNSGAAAPGTTFAFMLWADTTTGLLKIRNAANTNWVTIGTMATTNLALLALTGGTLTGALELDAFEDIASGATTDLGTTTSNFARITGTASITSFGSAAAGTWRILRFAAIATLVYNGTSMILPTSLDISTAANDCALAISLGSGNWIVLFYERSSGASLVPAAAPTTISASTHSLTNADNGGRFVYTAACSISLAHINSLAQGWSVELMNAATTSGTQLTVTGTPVLGFREIASGGSGPFLVQDLAGANSTRVMKINSWFDVFPRKWTSAIFPSSANQAYTTSHGLATRPRQVRAILLCTSGDASYVAGERVPTAAYAQQTAGTASWGLSVTASGGAIDIRVGVNGIFVNNKSTGAGVAITEGRWQLFFNLEG